DVLRRVDRQRLEDEGIVECEWRRGGGNTEGDRPAYDEGKRRGAPELADGVACVLPDAVEPVPAPRGARRGGDAGPVRARGARGRLGIIGLDPAVDQLFGAKRDVERYLLAKVAVQAALAQRIGQAKPELAERHSHSLTPVAG